ncbi:XRE family transcriptional regulator [Pediococcus pentosaceus]|uniref:spr1629 family repressor/antitoxin n=1 Tax=Pediococcus pentosaceus TaxID=1255 RepID=UPI00211C82D8|nr:XRE family transcriptional regulator [Pediococcus pentosaceus]MCQ9315330.1 XRE family transcriptional regulator [Pediococcus pentosaceus]MCQ9337842.1 XRE family transcriptional regulator [Pediococcus pentosaceus]
MFYGQNMKELRILFGMSRKELAEKLNVSQQAIGQYENGDIQPALDKIIQMGNLFKVESSFFIKRSFIESDTPKANIAYRAPDRSSRRNINEGAMMVRFAESLIDIGENYFEMGRPLINDVKEKIKQMQIANTILNEYHIEDYANVARKMFELNDNSNLLHKLEESGVYVIERKMMSESADAFSVWTRTNGTLKSPFMVLGTENKSAVRRIFDIAHELGHLLLHDSIDFEDLTMNEFRDYEKQANKFASAFLLPKAFVEDYLSDIDNKSIPDNYISAKEKYYVSLATAEYRAYDLGMITPSENKNFFRNRYRKKYTIREPLDDKLIIKKPGRFLALLTAIQQQNLISLKEFLSQLRITPQFLSIATGISKTLIDDILENENKFSFKIR